MSSSIKWNQKKLDLKTKSISLLYRKLEYKAKLTQKNHKTYTDYFSVWQKDSKITGQKEDQ